MLLISPLARAKQEEADLGEIQHFALKALSKKAVVERGQLAHVKDEKLLLQNMTHPLILGLYSTFQVTNIDDSFATHVKTDLYMGDDESCLPVQ